MVDMIRLVTTTRKLFASLATIAVAGGLMAFGTFGAFDDRRDHFPPPIIADLSAP
jgi:hypothetical protein